MMHRSARAGASRTLGSGYISIQVEWLPDRIQSYRGIARLSAVSKKGRGGFPAAPGSTGVRSARAVARQFVKPCYPGRTTLVTRPSGSWSQTLLGWFPSHPRSDSGSGRFPHARLRTGPVLRCEGITTTRPYVADPDDT